VLGRLKEIMKKQKRTTPINFRFNQQVERDLQLIPHAELEKFRHGAADDVSINTLAFRLNIGYVMSVDLFESEAVTKAMTAGLGALESVIARHSSTGKIGATGEEFYLMGEALNFTDEMQKQSTRREIEKILMKVMKLAGR
jgi:hypothetical protein